LPIYVLSEDEEAYHDVEEEHQEITLESFQQFHSQQLSRDKVQEEEIRQVEQGNKQSKNRQRNRPTKEDFRNDKEEQQRRQKDRMKKAQTERRGLLEKRQKAEQEKKHTEATSRQRFEERKREAGEEQKRRLAAQQKAKQATAIHEESQKRWQHSIQQRNYGYSGSAACVNNSWYHSASVAAQPPVRQYQATRNPAADQYTRQREAERMQQQQWQAHRMAAWTQWRHGQTYRSTDVNSQAQWQQHHEKRSEQQKSQTPYSTRNASGYTTPATTATRVTPTPPQQQPLPGNSKYIVAVDAGQDSIATIKKGLMTSWALQPPMFQTLRSVDELVSTIHLAFPPAFGVARHPYFSKWKPIPRQSLMQRGVPDKEELKRAIRKMRFFLHPDKLPMDLNEDQTFLCKTLWDVASDGWEQFNIGQH
jgi:hypothetical protein